MTVYVDDFMIRADVPNGGRVVRGVWCHMQADTREELDAMADKIGLKRSWIQHPEKPWMTHYDVTLSRRKLAIEAGAIEIGALDLARKRLEWRKAER
jgi:hypothetical protein